MKVILYSLLFSILLFNITGCSNVSKVETIAPITSTGSIEKAEKEGKIMKLNAWKNIHMDLSCYKTKYPNATNEELNREFTLSAERNGYKGESNKLKNLYTVTGWGILAIGLDKKNPTAKKEVDSLIDQMEAEKKSKNCNAEVDLIVNPGNGKTPTVYTFK